MTVNSTESRPSRRTARNQLVKLLHMQYRWCLALHRYRYRVSCKAVSSVVETWHSSRLSNSHIVGDDKVSYPNFENVRKANIAKYRHNYKNNFSDYKLKKKIESTQKKKAKLWTDHSPNLRSSSSRPSTDSSIPKCMICNEIDELKNLHAAGALHATKTKLKADHVTRQTEQLRHMAITIGGSRLESQLSIGNLGANSLFYHKLCYTKLYNDFIKKDNEKNQGRLDIPPIRAAAWDKVEAFMDEAEDNSSEFDINDLQDIYLDVLSK